MTDRQRNLRSAWLSLVIVMATFGNLFTHNRYGIVTIPVAFAAFAGVVLINLRR